MSEGLFEILKKMKTVEIKNDKGLDEVLARLGGSYEWKVLKEQVIEPKIRALLVMADDVAKAMEGGLTIEQLGVKTLVARIAAGHLQDIIDRVETTKEFLEKQAEEKKKRKEVKKRG